MRLIGFDVRDSWETAALWAAQAAGPDGYAWIQCLDSNASASTIRWVLAKEGGVPDQAYAHETMAIISGRDFESLPPSNRRIFPGYDVVYFVSTVPKDLQAPRFGLQNAADRRSPAYLAKYPAARIDPDEVGTWMRANDIVSAVASAEMRIVLFADGALPVAGQAPPGVLIAPLALFNE